MKDSIQTSYARAKQMAAYPLVIVAIGAEELAKPPFEGQAEPNLRGRQIVRSYGDLSIG